MIKARHALDWKDAHTILQERNPFTSLRSISTGVHAHNTMSMWTGKKTVGNTILNNMDGKTAAVYTFKRRDQVVTLDTKFSVKSDGDAVQINPVISCPLVRSSCFLMRTCLMHA